MNKKSSGTITTAMICFGLIAIVLWVYYAAAIREKMPEKKYDISVVLYDAGSDGWEVLMEGMKQAGEDFGINITYVVAKEGADKEDQLELIRTEIENGAQGVLVAATDSAMMCQEVQTEGAQIPIIMLESGTDDQTYPFISANNVALGKMLGETILADFPENESIKLMVVEEYMNRDSVKQRMQGLYDVLGNRIQITPIKRTLESEDLQNFLPKAIRGSNVDAVVALSKETLFALSEVDEEIIQDKKLYGIGNTDSIVAALDDEKIEKLVFQNEFNIGYLGVQNLIKEIEGIRTADIEEIDYYSVGKEDIFEMQYERLLFPIVE